MMQRVSDIIQAQDIEQWKHGDKILIRAGTGRGKTHFVKTVLPCYADTNNRILFLSNRKSLNQQTQNEVMQMGGQWLIECMTYQKLEKQILDEKVSLKEFKYIVCDEAHYFFMDSTFSESTNISADYIKDCTQDKIVIMMTATPKRLKAYFGIDDKHLYEIDTEYDYITQIYRYSKFETIIKMLNTLPKGEKAIFFTSAEKAYNASKQVYDASFICSESNSRKRSINKKELKSIQEQSRFDSRVLCTTIVLDNGINIIDEQVKHVVVDIMDIDTVIQCIGRKRILSANDTITLYVADKKPNSIQTHFNKICKDLEQPLFFREHGERVYRKKYRKQEQNRLLIDVEEDIFKINEVAAWKYSELKADYKLMLEMQDGWLRMLMQEMALEDRVIRSLERELDAISLEMYLNDLIGVKIFSEEREIVKQSILEHMVGKIEKNRRKLGIKSINGILGDLGVPYTFISHKETKGERRNQQYWMLNAT